MPFQRMPVTRVYQTTPLSIDATITLDQQGTHHLLKVLRMRSSDQIRLFNGDGREYTAMLNISGKTVTANITHMQDTARESPAQITLVQGVSYYFHRECHLHSSGLFRLTIGAPILVEG